MNLRDTITKADSKANCTRIVNWIGSNQNRKAAFNSRARKIFKK